MKYNSEEFAAMQAGVQLEKKEASYVLLTAESDIEAGRAIYMGVRNACFTCHGNELQGLVGPNLTDEYWLNGGDVKSIVNSIVVGNIQKGMQPYGMGKAVRLNDEELLQVTSFIISKLGSNPPNPKPVDMTRAKKFEGQY